MKSVLISIQPYWVFLIIAKTMGWNVPQEKTIEARKNYPKADDWNKVIKIYCSKDEKSFSKIPVEYHPFMERFLGKVIGEFVCDQLCWVLAHPEAFAGHPLFFQKAIDDACLTQEEVDRYSGGKDVIGWHISQLKLYDRPRYLGRFVVPSRVGCCNEGKCRGCQFFIRGNAMAGIEADCTAIFNTDEYKPLRRPPQSWCYVKELGR